MAFIVTRFLALGVGILCAVLLIQRSTIRKKALAQFISIGVWIMIIAATSMFPVENVVLKFETPADVFGYAKTGEIQHILYGENTVLIVYTDQQGTISHYLVPQVDDGWVIPNCNSLNKVHQKCDNNGTVDIYCEKNTNDYYGFAATGRLPEGEAAIIDESGNVLSQNILNISGTGFYYFRLPDLLHEYYLLLNGEKILLFE